MNRKHAYQHTVLTAEKVDEVMNVFEESPTKSLHKPQQKINLTYSSISVAILFIG